MGLLKRLRRASAIYPNPFYGKCNYTVNNRNLFVFLAYISLLDEVHDAEIYQGINVNTLSIICLRMAKKQNGPTL